MVCIFTWVSSHEASAAAKILPSQLGILGPIFHPNLVETSSPVNRLQHSAGQGCVVIVFVVIVPDDVVVVVVVVNII